MILMYPCSGNRFLYVNSDFIVLFVLSDSLSSDYPPRLTTVNNLDLFLIYP